MLIPVGRRQQAGAYKNTGATGTRHALQRAYHLAIGLHRHVGGEHACLDSSRLFSSPSLVSEARKYMGTNPTARKKLWCATFMNMVLAKAGYTGTNSDAAKSFAYYGRRISEPRVGAIAVLTRGRRGGHVGVVSGIDARGNPIIISGNHNKRVGEAVYSRARVIAYVMPTDRPSTTQLAARGQPSTSELALNSPIAELLAAIEAEQNRSEQPARPAAPPQPHRQVQQSGGPRYRPVPGRLVGHGQRAHAGGAAAASGAAAAA